MSDPVSRLADEIEAELRAAFLDAIEDMATVDVTSLTAAAEHADDDDVVAFVADRLRPLNAILDRAFTHAGTLAADRLGLSFDPAEPAALAARAAAIATTMRPLIADTAKAMVQAAFRSTLPPVAERASIVREAIGLSPAQGASLSVFRAALESVLAQQQPEGPRRPGFTRELPNAAELPAHALRHLSAPQRSMIGKAGQLPLDRARIEKLVADQRRALLQVRAASIATAGALTATNAGEHASWNQAVQRRDLGPEWRRFWRDAGDERVRHAHREVSDLNPNGVGLDEPFATPLGPCLYPPLEANCRCRAELQQVPA